MKTVIVAVRILLGLAFVVLGANFFLELFKVPAPSPTPVAGQFIGALVTTDYMKVIKVIEITGGALLLTGLLAPLGLVLLTPVIVNILLWDLFLMRQPGLGIPLLAMDLFFLWGYRPYFAPIFTLTARPAACCKSS